MRVLVIGGNRFVGRLLLDRLVSRGCEVTVFNRGRMQSRYPDGVTHVIGDRKDYPRFRHTFGKASFDVVVDMVAYERSDIIAVRDTFAGRIDQYIFMSSSFVYAVTKCFVCPIRESAFSADVIEPASVSNYKQQEYAYGVNKRECEEELQTCSPDVFHVTVLRPPFIIGESDHALLPSYVCRLLDGGPMILPDGGLNSLTLAYAPDVADAIASCLANQDTYGQALNLGNDEVVNVRELMLAIAEHLEVERRVIDIPSWFLQERIDASAFPCSNSFNIILSTTYAKRLIKFRSTTLDDALRRSVKAVGVRCSRSVTEEYKTNRPHELAVIREWKELVGLA